MSDDYLKTNLTDIVNRTDSGQNVHVHKSGHFGYTCPCFCHISFAGTKGNAAYIGDVGYLSC